MATINICDRCGAQRQRSQYEWFHLTLADDNRNPAEPAAKYDLCPACAKALAAQEDWILI